MALVGRVLRPHGLDGSLRIRPLSDNPKRFLVGESLTVAGRSWTVASFRATPGDQALLGLEGLSDPASARALTGEWLYAAIDPADALPPGEYYHYQLIGLSVATDEGEALGTIREILTTGSNDVYVVDSGSGSDILLPAISQVIKHVDLESGAMLVHLIDGLR